MLRNCKKHKMDDKIITLNSQDSLLFYPNNTGNDFTNVLPMTVRNCKQYEVALAELFFTTESKFFKSKEDSKVIIRREEGENQICSVQIQANNWADFIKQVNDINCGVNISLNDDKRIEITLDSKLLKTGVKITKELSSILGFTSLVVRNKKTVGAQKVKDEGNLSITFLLQTLPVYIHTEVFVHEPEKYDLESLLEQVNENLFFEHKCAFQKEGNSLFFVSPPKTKINLSPKLSSIFNVKPTKWIENNERLSNLILKDSFIIRVYCNIAEAQIFGNEYKKWIRLINSNSNVKGEHIVLDKLLYLPVETDSIRAINIRLLNEKENLVSIEPSAETVAVLHFRKKI